MRRGGVSEEGGIRWREEETEKRGGGGKGERARERGKETVEEGAGQLMEGQEGKEMGSSPVMSAVCAPSPSPSCIPGR